MMTLQEGQSAKRGNLPEKKILSEVRGHWIEKDFHLFSSLRN